MTKEEILEKAWNKKYYDGPHEYKDSIFKTRYELITKDAMDEYTTHLTDQIKSMENYISDVDGQVRELERQNKELSDSGILDHVEIESLQKENEQLKTYRDDNLIHAERFHKELTTSEAKLKDMRNGVESAVRFIETGGQNFSTEESAVEFWKTLLTK